ncbi:MULTISPECIES: flagellar basal body-associated FliL family protein [Simplicispira]|uniref:Flagellar protein FliL n=1 Tax=Simplicispira metamorpha TaxID=80881 RepID=A0A4R2N1X2_9BURK|nr:MULTISPECIES: flagellar basal body-associated FliL family protein [Simplicispira]MDD2690529.1 flagellar basal body-associated FliL family protein [Simplicispira sp.]TCP13550.1 flagellar FliL protein [Simplicispira metamorpha]
MSTPAPAAEPATKPAKSKKLLLIGGVLLLLLIVAGGAAAWFMSQKQALDENGEPIAAAPKAAVAPTFLPLENMVVNLADPGGDRFVQLGITLELADDKTADKVKQYMPSVRSSILMLLSQRTAEDLLLLEGKEKLALDIQREVARPLGFRANEARNARPADAEGDDPPPRRQQNPVRRVLFSSFIIQ